MKVRVAVAPAAGVSNPGVFGSFVDGVERLGFDTVWLSDIPLGASIDPIVGLSFAAARTSRLKLGCNLVPLGRNPFVVAKELAQLDGLSGGRLLLSLVPGVGLPAERAALGVGDADRGKHLDEIIPLLRAWWAGETIDYHSERLRFSAAGLALPCVPVQQPLEIWLGGAGPRALERAGRLADGWLGSAMTPDEAGEARRRIEAAASKADREVDPEHFGLSLGYLRSAPSEMTLAALRARRPDVPDADLRSLLPVGGEALCDALARYVDRGISKFVVRPAEPVPDWEEELGRLAATVLKVQT
jgi:probable F420-dependent oxidoreductase